MCCASPSHPLFRLPSNNGPHRFFPRLSRWIIPFQQGPLFLACPPWKLSQFATPLYLQGNGFVRRRVEALNLNLNLLRARTRFPLKLFDRVDSKSSESDEHDLVGSFFNAPNFISFSRLISGPLLGCLGLRLGIEKTAWDNSGERLAVSFKDGDEAYRGLIAIYDTRRTPLIFTSLIGFIRGPGDNPKPIALSFHGKFKQWPLLSVVSLSQV
ncbi:hypothetical protein K1719_041544 [Acacia pycnantha]|nr:hypothetical protein K1719_041544 [Acacia pycnantha]